MTLIKKERREKQKVRCPKARREMLLQPDPVPERHKASAAQSVFHRLLFISEFSFTSLL